jgi:hypothetical protein
MKSPLFVPRVLFAGACALLLLGGCRSKAKPETEGKAVAPTAETPTAEPTASTNGSAGRPVQGMYNIPVGPSFAIEPGTGLGPIRFGATTATIERLMEAPCTEKSETLCRYSFQAVDFHLEGGVLKRIHIHGNERPFSTENPAYVYGIFNGQVPGGVEIGMYRSYVEEVLGKGISGREITAREDGKPYPTVYISEYPGMTLEFDKLRNGNVVLAGIILTKAVVPAAAAPAKSARPRAPLH